MPSTIQGFSVGYNPINQSNTFTCGDQITGQITLELSKECKIDSLSVKMKGKAEVRWTENRGKKIVTYQDKEKYFSFQQFLIEVNQGNNMVNRGCHVYPFTFRIPAQELPPSFRGTCGKIVYSLEANLSRSMKLDSIAKAKFTLLHSGNPGTDLSLMTPQRNMVDKTLLFKSGKISMDVNVTQTAFRQGEGIKIVASVSNNSSRDVMLKYCLYKKNSYFAKGKREVETEDILKEVGETIPPSANLTATRVITIPPTTGVSILNCDIIKAEYRLKVYLDVKYAFDPTIKFPIVILPSLQAPGEEQPPSNPAYGFDTFAYSNIPGGTSFPNNPAAWGASAPHPAYGTYPMYPTLIDFAGKQ